MSILILPSKRIVQPDNASLAYKEDITRGLAFSFDTISRREIVGNRNPTYLQSTKQIVKEGVGFVTETGNAYAEFPIGSLKSSDGSYTGDFTFEAICYPGLSAAVLINTTPVGAPYTQCGLYVNTDADYAYGNDRLAFNFYSGGIQHISASGSVGSGYRHYIATRLNGTGYLYANGVLVASGSSTLPMATDGGTIGIGGYSESDSRFPARFPVLQVNAWNRGLSSVEVKDRYDNPWKIFKNRNRVVYFEAGAGGSSLTQASRFDNTNSFYAPTVTTGQVTLTADLFSNSNSFYTHTVTQSGITQTLTQDSVYQNSNTFYSSIVSSGGFILQQESRLDNTNAFYEINVTPGTVTLTASLFTNSNTFFTHTISQVSPQTLTQSSRFDNTNTFYSATVGAGATLTTADIEAIMAAMRIEFATELAHIAEFPTASEIAAAVWNYTQ